MKLTLLGTGTPSADPARRGPSQVIETGNDLVLVDAGAGSLHRLVEAGYMRAALGAGPAQPQLRRILFTHLHSDHCTGIADILWFGWIGNLWQDPPVISGPPGTADFIRYLLLAYDYDIRVRSAGGEPGMQRDRLEPRVEEVEEGSTFETNGLRMSAFRVEHDPCDQAFGYRIEDGTSSVVISGDTSYSENLVRHAQDADLMVHEVYWSRGFQRTLSNPETPEPRKQRIRFVQKYHTGSDELGRIANEANARRLVMSHLIMAGTQPADLLADVEATYKGKATVGEDLMTFELAR